MKMTIREVMTKIKDIENAANAVEHARDLCDDDGLLDAEDLLREYRLKILDSEINI